jgi:peptidoglycan/xylan/chitin deacetylase (PgdA/CDA1 family)
MQLRRLGLLLSILSLAAAAQSQQSLLALAHAAVRAAGTEPGLYRPLGSRSILRRKTPVSLETVDAYDYTRPGEGELLRRILTATKPGFEIQLHAGVEQTRSTLSRVIQALRTRGSTFETLR